MKKFMVLLLALVMVLGLAACGGDDKGAESSGEKEVFKIGVIQLVKHDALDRAYEGFVDELAEMGYVDGENIEIEYQNASNDQSNCLTIAESMVNDEKDLIFAIATPAAQAAASKTEDIPILVSAVTDPAGSGLIESNDAPGRNLSGTSDLTPVAQQIKLLKEVVPDAKNFAVLYCSNESNSEIQVRLAKEAAEEYGLEVVEASVSSSNEIQQMVSSLVGKVDAIYVPTDNTIVAGMETVSMVATEAKIPVICGEAGSVKGGGLISMSLDYYDLGARTARQAIRILEDGEDISKMPIEYIGDDELKYYINGAVAEAIGITTIPEEIMEAATIYE